MIASAGIEAPKCPTCNKPMRLTCVVPSTVPKGERGGDPNLCVVQHYSHAHLAPGLAMATKRLDYPIEPMDLANMRENGVRSLAIQCHHIGVR